MKDVKKHISSGTDPVSNGPKDRPSAYGDHAAGGDEPLIARSRTGDMAAFAELVAKYQDRLFNAILRIVGQYADAEELTQETFVRALQAIGRFGGRSSFYTWIFRIGMNLSITHRKRRLKVRLVPFQAAGDFGDGQAAHLAELVDKHGRSPSAQAQINESYRAVLAAMEELDTDARAVMVLRDIEELDYAQIGRILEIPVGTVKSRLSRARMAIRDKLS